MIYFASCEREFLPLAADGVEGAYTSSGAKVRSATIRGAPL